MALRSTLVYSKAWTAGGGVALLPATVDNEPDARENLQIQHDEARAKINEIVGAITDTIGAGNTAKIPSTAAVKEAIDAIPSQQQADWNQTDTDAPDYIKNKPNIPSEVTIDTEINASSTNPVQNKAIYQALLNMVYPVGSIYMSVNSVSPASFLGGTWERIQDKFLLAAGSSHGAGATGGSETAALSQHKHKYDNIYIEPATIQKSPNGEWVLVYDSSASGGELSAKSNGQTRNEGTGTDPISTMPPYLAVYVWKRVS